MIQLLRDRRLWRCRVLMVWLKELAISSSMIQNELIRWTSAVIIFFVAKKM